MLKLSQSSNENRRLVFQVLVQATPVECFDLALSFDPLEVDLSTNFKVTGLYDLSFLSNKMGSSSMLAVGYTTSEAPGQTGGTLLQTSLALMVPGATSAAVTEEGLYSVSLVTVHRLTTVLGGSGAPVNRLPWGTVILSIPEGSKPKQGQALTVTNSLVHAKGPRPIAHILKTRGATIGTGAAYTLQQADVGKAIIVTASCTDCGELLEAVSSASIAQICFGNAAGLIGIAPASIADEGRVLHVDRDASPLVSHDWLCRKRTERWLRPVIDISVRKLAARRRVEHSRIDQVAYHRKQVIQSKPKLQAQIDHHFQELSVHCGMQTRRRMTAVCNLVAMRLTLHGHSAGAELRSEFALSGRGLLDLYAYIRGGGGVHVKRDHPFAWLPEVNAATTAFIISRPTRRRANYAEDNHKRPDTWLPRRNASMSVFGTLWRSSSTRLSCKSHAF